MSVDAACTACCCSVAPSTCCFPDTSKSLELSYSWRNSVFAGGTEVKRLLHSGVISATMTRFGNALTGYEMRSTAGSAQFRTEYFAKISKGVYWGTSCAGFPNEYYCPPCNQFVDCEYRDWVYSGPLASNDLKISCIDPCAAFNAIRKTFVLAFAPTVNQYVGTFTERLGNNEPVGGYQCIFFPQTTTQSSLDISAAGHITPTVWGKEGCLDSSTFSGAHVPSLAQSELFTEFDGLCAPNAEFSAFADCNQWFTNPAYRFPARMGFTVSSCPVLRCNPYGTGFPTECVLLDCNGQVISSSISGCDSFPENYTGAGTGCEISVRAEVALSVSVVYV